MSNSRLNFSFVLIAPMIFMSCPAAADQCDDLRDEGNTYRLTPSFRRKLAMPTFY